MGRYQNPEAEMHHETFPFTENSRLRPCHVLDRTQSSTHLSWVKHLLEATAVGLLYLASWDRPGCRGCYRGLRSEVSVEEPSSHSRRRESGNRHEGREEWQNRGECLAFRDFPRCQATWIYGSAEANRAASPQDPWLDDWSLLELVTTTHASSVLSICNHSKSRRLLTLSRICLIRPVGHLLGDWIGLPRADFLHPVFPLAVALCRPINSITGRKPEMCRSRK